LVSFQVDIVRQVLHESNAGKQAYTYRQP
jgi:hypothetical protein